MPESVLARGQRTKYSDELRKIGALLRKPWSLFDTLTTEHGLSPGDAQAVTDFLHPLLAYEPRERPSAKECMELPWLSSVNVNDFATAFL